VGSLERPMGDRDLEAKFHGLADGVLGAARAGELVEACWQLGAARDVKALVERARP
jgi:hypothetical protein